MSGERDWIERMKRDDVDGVADPQVSILVREIERVEAERDGLRTERDAVVAYIRTHGDCPPMQLADEIDEGWHMRMASENGACDE